MTFQRIYTALALTMLLAAWTLIITAWRTPRAAAPTTSAIPASRNACAWLDTRQHAADSGASAQGYLPGSVKRIAVNRSCGTTMV
jgi:hypothetical protein